MSETTEYVEFVPLKLHPKYEISTSYPFVIRNILSGRIIKQYITALGYLNVKIDSTTIPLHRIIAEQFITPNIHGMDVSHINHKRLDNRIENLEVITHSENLKNRNVFIKQVSEYIPQDEVNKTNLVRLERYKNSEFNKYYFDKINEKVYIHQERYNRYKVVKPTKNGKYYIISLIPINKPTLTLIYDKFIKYCKKLSTDSLNEMNE